jgi:hypothetical protein
VEREDKIHLPLVLVGAVDPIVTAALSSAWAGKIEVRQMPLVGRRLASQARLWKARGVVVPPADAVECSLAAPDALVLGLSVVSTEAILCVAGNPRSVSNPTLSGLADALSEHAG